LVFVVSPLSTQH